MKRTPLPPRRHPLRRISAKRRRQQRAQDVVKIAVLERDGHRCRLADAAERGLAVGQFLDGGGTVQVPVPACWGILEAHHLGKQSQQGEDTLDNEVTLCTGHNRWVETEPIYARALGLVVSVPLRKVANVFPRVAP